MDYRRILLKISGEALKGEQKEDILDSNILHELARVIKKVTAEKVAVGIVVGGGNIWRGRVAKDFNLERENADYMGMTATIINALVIKNVLEVEGVKAVAVSDLEMPNVIENYSPSKINALLDEGYVVIFGGGTGKPFFSTDTAAALRAKEINAETILAGKNGVDGFYSDDPTVNPNAKFYPYLSYDEIIEKNLGAMDIESIKICKENDIAIRVFNINDLNNILKVVKGSTIGTYIGKENK